MLACLALAVFFGTRLSMFTVDTIVVKGLETIPEGDVRSRADALLAGAYYGIVPYRFSPTIPTERIIESVESLARVASATVSTEGKQVVVTVVEHEPEMVWCGSASTSPCYYVDRSGIAYEKTPGLVGSALMRFVVVGTDPMPGASLLRDEIRSLLIDIARILEERHAFRIARIEYEENGDAVLYLSQGGRLLLTTSKDLATTYDNLTSVLSSEQYANLKPGTFEYIDLRFGNKVFVQKEKPIATTTASTTGEVE
jgi:cell division septal protein FtsQ